MMKTIVKAAILHEGVVFEGARHCQIIQDIVAKTGCKRVPGSSKQGFVTSSGRFVNRVDAGIIAMNAGQIKRLKYSTLQLFSEELWDKDLKPL